MVGFRTCFTQNIAVISRSRVLDKYSPFMYSKKSQRRKRTLFMITLITEPAEQPTMFPRSRPRTRFVAHRTVGTTTTSEILLLLYNNKRFGRSLKTYRSSQKQRNVEGNCNRAKHRRCIEKGMRIFIQGDEVTDYFVTLWKQYV